MASDILKEILDLDMRARNAIAGALNLKITPASGGTIVEIDHNESRVGDLYVIDESKDLGTELGKIITMHYLKKDNKNERSS